jgi:hypothetical protein
MASVDGAVAVGGGDPGAFEEADREGRHQHGEGAVDLSFGVREQEVVLAPDADPAAGNMADILVTQRAIDGDPLADLERRVDSHLYGDGRGERLPDGVAEHRRRVGRLVEADAGANGRFELDRHGCSPSTRSRDARSTPATEPCGKIIRLSELSAGGAGSHV